METKDIILKLRIENGLSQEELAEKIYVTRQAVSRWETGETSPNIDTLKLLSKLFDVSINTLLGSPRQLICRCCGMPLEDSILGKEKDGLLNEEYCKWCYVDGEYTYKNINCFKRYEEIDESLFHEFKLKLIDEINDLRIEGMPVLESLNALEGRYVNLDYRLPNGTYIRFLDDEMTYLGNQLECLYHSEICFGIVADMDFILVCCYEEDGKNPELIVYKKR